MREGLNALALAVSDVCVNSQPSEVEISEVSSIANLVGKSRKRNLGKLHRTHERIKKGPRRPRSFERKYLTPPRVIETQPQTNFGNLSAWK
jgi:hypothetical protein